MSINTKLTREEIDQYRSLIEQGLSQRQACTVLGVSRGIIQHYLKRYAELQNEKMKQSIHRYQNTEHGESFDEFDFFEGEPKKTSFAEVCSNVANAIGNIGKALSGESNERYLELSNTENVENNQPKICYLDIECSPTKSYTWRRFKENISQAQILSESFFLTASWAFNENEVHSLRLTSNEAINEDDEVLITKLWHVLDNSNVVVGHNLRRFDIKKINSRFAYYNLPSPSPYKIIDTLEIAKARFAFPSNKLNDLCEYLDIGEKLPHDGFSLWKKCCAGDDEALIHMEKYNRVDVEITRELYKRLRGFDNNAVNLAIMSDKVGAICTTCCSDDIAPLEDKFAFTPNGKYQVYVCNHCNTKLRSTSRIGVANKLVRVV